MLCGTWLQHAMGHGVTLQLEIRPNESSTCQVVGIVIAVVTDVFMDMAIVMVMVKGCEGFKF